MPRICKGLFERIEFIASDSLEFKVQVSYFEIYKEKIKDLFSRKDSGHNLKVRNDTEKGPYVDGLSNVTAAGYDEVKALMVKGNSRRTTGHTDMNNASSRSHAVFTIAMTERWWDAGEQAHGEKTSRMSLIDLAGSERQPKSQGRVEGKAKATTKAHVKESAKINQSLSTLGLVIKSLCEESDAAASARITAGSPSRPDDKSYASKTGKALTSSHPRSRTPARPPAQRSSETPGHRSHLGTPERSRVQQRLFHSSKSDSSVAEGTALATRAKQRFVPYRDSILTWLLKDSLGGNSKTFMLATLSPSFDNFEETLSTLRYANSCKQIVNQAVVNEDASAFWLRTRREQLRQEQLRHEQLQQEALKIATHAREIAYKAKNSPGSRIMNPLMFLVEWVFKGGRDPCVAEKKARETQAAVAAAKFAAEHAKCVIENHKRLRSQSFVQAGATPNRHSRPRSYTMSSLPNRHPSEVYEAAGVLPARKLNVSFSSQESCRSSEFAVPPNIGYGDSPIRVINAKVVGANSHCEHCHSPVATMVIPFRTEPEYSHDDEEPSPPSHSFYQGKEPSSPARLSPRVARINSPARLSTWFDAAADAPESALTPLPLHRTESIAMCNKSQITRLNLLPETPESASTPYRIERKASSNGSRMSCRNVRTEHSRSISTTYGSSNPNAGQASHGVDITKENSARRIAKWAELSRPKYVSSKRNQQPKKAQFNLYV